MQHISQGMRRLADSLSAKSESNSKREGCITFEQCLDAGGFARWPTRNFSENPWSESNRPATLDEAIAMVAEALPKLPERPSPEQKRDICQRECDEYNRIPGSLKGKNCDLCRNKGKILIPTLSKLHNDYLATVFDCKCLPARVARERLENSGLRSMFAECSLDNFDTGEPWQRKMVDKAARYIAAAHQGYWFYVGGDAGSGKTHLCAGILKELLDSGLPCKWMDWTDDSTRILNGWRSDYDAALEPWRKAKVLIIDDFLKIIKGGRSSSPTPDAMKLAYSLVDYRYKDASLVTVFSSESNLEAITRFDLATGSRIEHRCGAGFVLDNLQGGTRNVRHKYGFQKDNTPNTPPKSEQMAFDDFVDESLYGV